MLRGMELATGFSDELIVEAPASRGEPISRRRAAVASRLEIAALEQALELGIDNVTVEGIAQAAGVSRRNFYRYFATIDEALCAVPRRSVQRLAELLLARPNSENIFQAIIAVGKLTHPDEIETAERILVNRIAEREPAAWWRVINAGGVNNVDGMERVVRARLIATGEDPDKAALVTAVYLAVVNLVGRTSVAHGCFGIDNELVEAGLRDLSDFMHRSLNA